MSNIARINKANSLAPGLDNLLFNCIGAREGETLTIISEGDLNDYYSPSLSEVIAAHARGHGLEVKIVSAPFMEEVVALPANIQDAITKARHTLFLARIGDQVRFSTTNKKGAATMCYALDEHTFASSFCTADYRFFVRVKDLINAKIWGGDEIKITCPSGTSLIGAAPAETSADEDDDVTVKRFPMSVFRPVPAASFSGRIALTKWLCGTGTRFYKPYSLIFDETVFAKIKNGHITGFEGSPAQVEKIERHYDFVSNKYGIARNVVHSWHAGIHPVNGYAGHAVDDLMRWSGTAFGNPRYLHFHTCGDVPPGEICVSVFDPTIAVDGVDLWRRGEFVFAQSPELQDLMQKYPGVRELYANPTRDIGLCGESF